MEKKIRALIKQAMIDKNKNKQLTYKSILENAQKIAKNDGNRVVTNDDFIKATKNEIKQLNDLYEYVKMDDVKGKEVCEKIGYCQDILPKMANEQEIMEYLVSNNIDKNIGTCMRSLKEHFGANMDGKLANNIVRQYIA